MIKLVKMNDITKANLVTHAGVFHADEVVATVILKKILGDVTVCRTFKVPTGAISDNVIIYDIGGGKYDHHQKGGNGLRDNGVPYAATGLIWQAYGLKLLANNNSCNPELVWNYIDREIIQGIDAVDNGKMPRVNYPTHSLSFTQIISAFNPNWDSEEDTDIAFARAVEFAECVFDRFWAKAESKAKAKSIVETAIEQAVDHIMVLEKFVPWEGAVFSSENSKAATIYFAVFPSNRGGYNWKCVPDLLGSFGQRCTVPTAWWGLQGIELQKLTGVKTATFCHPAGFIGGAETLEDTIKMARIAIEG
jgi:uncharacterized UPF0160 family protein